MLVFIQKLSINCLKLFSVIFSSLQSIIIVHVSITVGRDGLSSILYEKYIDFWRQHRKITPNTHVWSFCLEIIQISIIKVNLTN